jgi:hypothetical protein
VFAHLIGEARRLSEDVLTLLGWGFAIVLAGMIALFFFTFAAFVSAQDTYGTVTAALILGLFFLAVTVAILITILVIRRRAAARQLAKRGQQWWNDPAVIATGVELVRIIGVRRIVPAVALGAVILGAVQAGLSSRTKDDKRK